ncbi:hypothetical protein Tco_0927930 [Tanacetum coccineum]
METQKPLLKDEDGEEVDVHMYRTMIGSLMYLTSSRLNIMFAVCACERYQVNPKVSHLHVVKRIFRYLKGKPKLGLWYPKDYLFDLVAYTDSDHAGASLDRKSTTGVCQFLRCRLISWQCKKQTVVANSTTEAEYVAVSKKAKKSVRLIMEKLVIRESRQRVLVSKRIERVVNAGDSKLMLLGITYRCWLYVNAARHNLLLSYYCWVTYYCWWKLMLLGINLLLLVMVNDVEAKIVNGEVQLQALVDRKKIIITESIVRRDLQLEDAEGVDCLPNSTIFEQLTVMGEFTFAKSHTKKDIWEYKERVGKGFSRRETPLFQTMMVQYKEEVGEGSEMPTDPHHTPTIIQSSTSKPQKTQKPRRSKRKDTKVPQPSGPTTNVADEAINEEMGDSLERGATIATAT